MKAYEKRSLKKQEKERIYQEWLDGAWIVDLARKYRHWRSTIEVVVTELARASVPAHVFQQQVTVWQQAAACLRQERSHLARACEVREYVERRDYDGEEAAKQWWEDYYDSHKALCGKLKAMRRTQPGLVHFQYDLSGLAVDVVPFKPEPEEVPTA